MVSGVGFDKMIKNMIRNIVLVKRPGVILKFKAKDSILSTSIDSRFMKKKRYFYHHLEATELWISTSNILPHF